MLFLIDDELWLSLIKVVWLKSLELDIRGEVEATGTTSCTAYRVEIGEIKLMPTTNMSRTVNRAIRQLIIRLAFMRYVINVLDPAAMVQLKAVFFTDAPPKTIQHLMTALNVTKMVRSTLAIKDIYQFNIDVEGHSK